MKVFDDSVKVRTACARLTERDGWTSGDVVTRFGIVSVYYERDFLRLDFVKDGRLVMRNIGGKEFTKRGILRMAAKFAKELSQ